MDQSIHVLNRSISRGCAGGDTTGSGLPPASRAIRSFDLVGVFHCGASQRDRECPATGKLDKALQLRVQRALIDRLVRILQLGVLSKHACDERRSFRSVQRRRPSCGVIGFDTLAVLTVARLIVMFDGVVSCSLTLLGQIDRSSGTPSERSAEIAEEVPIRQGAGELVIAARSGQFHDGTRLPGLLRIRALLRSHVIGTTPSGRDLPLVVARLAVALKVVVLVRASTASRANIPVLRRRPAECSA